MKMKRLLCALVLLLPLTFVSASDWQLVRIPVPLDQAANPPEGFHLFHRAGDYWIGSLPTGAKLPPGGIVLDRFQPDGGEVFRLLLPTETEAVKLYGKVNILYEDEDEVIFQATPQQLENLPAVDAFWTRVTLIPKPIGYTGVFPTSTDDFHPMVQEFVNQVSQTQYTQYVQTLQDFITRNSRTSNCDSAAAWIYNTMAGFGLQVQYHNFTLSGMTKRNVIGELTGSVYPDSVLFITGHYDATAGNPYIAEPTAPGADDNASGTACVLECARILSQYNFEKTIRFVTFAGEEQGLVGSQAYVQYLYNAGTRVIGSFNWDMIAWSGTDPLPPDLVIYADNNPRSQAMANKIAEAITTFLPAALEPDIDISPSMTGSDHSPFWDMGWPAICGIEEQAWGPDFNPYYHSVNDVISNCDLPYATNCTRAAIAALADYAIPLAATGPYLAVQNRFIDDLNGNQNGMPDPGETISILVTLINVGSEPATGIGATLTTTNPYLTITQNSATFPNIAPQMTGIASAPYILNISTVCPQGSTVSTNLNITAAGGYSTTAPINFIVGDPLYDPVGPDAYGYYALDILDQNGPVYNWMEVDPMSGGPGTVLNFTSDDQTLSLNLPFIFTYYGLNYTQISVCSNGWVAMGLTTDTDYSNSAIPNPDGPPAMIAPFWEDLSPQALGRVAYHYNSSGHFFVVEYNGVRQYTPNWATETFEVILYDPAFHQTPTGDGKILFQYKRVSDPSSCTVGVEDPTETIGLQYLYNANYNPHAAQLDSGMAILFTTLDGFPDVTIQLTPYGAPIQIPVYGGSFNYNVAIMNQEPAAQSFAVWCDVTLPNGSSYGPVLGPVNLTLNSGVSIARDRTQVVPGTAPSGVYSYHAYAGLYPNAVWATDSFNFIKTTTGYGPMEPAWMNWGDSFDEMAERGSCVLPMSSTLEKPFPNPFNPTATFRFALAEASHVELQIYDVSGRLVTTLINGWREAGLHEAVFDAEQNPSGIYLYRFRVGTYESVGKMALVK
jgi:hypothetical protein